MSSHSEFPFPILFKNVNNRDNNNNSNNNNNNDNSENSHNVNNDKNTNNDKSTNKNKHTIKNENTSKENTSNSNSNTNNVQNNHFGNTYIEQDIEIIPLAISKSEHLSEEKHKELLDLAIVEQKIVWTNLQQYTHYSKQAQLFGPSLLSVNLDLNTKISELIQWETGVREIYERSVEDKSERKALEKTIIESLKGKIGQLFFRKAHIQKQIQEFERKAELHKFLRNSAAEEVDKIISRLAL